MTPNSSSVLTVGKCYERRCHGSSAKSISLPDIFNGFGFTHWGKIGELVGLKKTNGGARLASSSCRAFEHYLGLMSSVYRLGSEASSFAFTVEVIGSNFTVSFKVKSFRMGILLLDDD